jgi:hypothetical protein
MMDRLDRGFIAGIFLTNDSSRIGAGDGGISTISAVVTLLTGVTVSTTGAAGGTGGTAIVTGLLTAGNGVLATLTGALAVAATLPWYLPQLEHHCAPDRVL